MPGLPGCVLAKKGLMPMADFNSVISDAELLPSFAGRRVLVVGDAVLDRYWFGDAERLSREAPVPVLINRGETLRCGGAANAAANVAAMGASATLLAAAGSDREGEMLAQCCRQAGFELVAVQSQSSTASKLRIVAQGQQMLRVDSDSTFGDAAEKIAQQAGELASQHDVVLLSDYGLGSLAECAQIIGKAKIPLVVDPRGGNWQRYRGASLLTPNLAEFAAGSAGQSAQEVIAGHDLDALLVTMGKEGMRLHQRDHPVHSLPSYAREVFDVTGAGDTVCALMALGLAAGMPLIESMYLANKAAGIAVAKLGAVAVTAEDFAGSGSGRIIAPEHIGDYARQMQQQGKNLVMTNGCYDILHAGHLASLAAAARLGDVLVVAVNDDESVAALKGESRPINSLGQRMRLLAGLACVDAVTSFSGPTAGDTIEAVRPNIYAKGKDWQDKDSPDAQTAQRTGAKVVYLDMVAGLSTSAIVAKAKCS